MRASARLAWRVAAVAAFAGTAALAITLTRGTSLHVALISARGSSPARRHAVAAPRLCAPSRLDISIASRAASVQRAVASHGHVYTAVFPVEFTNISSTACTLSGYPQVSAYRAGGAQVGNAAVLDTSVSARRIVLAPGGTAHSAVAEIIPSDRCRPVAAAGLRVVAPGQSVPRYVRYAMTACSAIGQKAPVFLRVWAVQPGAGVTIAAGGHR